MINYSKNAETAGIVPSVHITTNKNRQKRYNSASNSPIYYLNHKDEFQIELYNPTQHVIRCDISLNGKKIEGGGLVLKPAERVFLDRYFNTPDKFLFETYEVGTSKSDTKAIELNGSVKVEFYKEQEPSEYLGYMPISTTITYGGSFGGPVHSENIFTTTSTGTAAMDSIDCFTTQADYSYTTTTSNTTLLTDSPDPTRQMKSKSSKKTETGRIGKGDVSNQKFTNVHYDFDYTPFYTVEYKLLPHSQKTQNTDTISSVRYCTQCGTKVKPTFKFCAQCGTKA